MRELGPGVTSEDVAELQSLLERHARLKDDFVLSSGLHSKFYFDSKPVTLSPDGNALVGRILERVVSAVGAEAVGGLQIGAIPIADAISRESFETGSHIPAFVVRDEKKGHGTKEKIAASYSIRDRERGIRAGTRIAIVDDVVTTGDSIQGAIDAVKASGCVVVAVVALVTRPEANAAQVLGARYDYISLFDCDIEGNLTLSARVQEIIGTAVA